MNPHNSLKDLLQKYRDNAISREEFDQLVKHVNNTATEAEIKYWMMEQLYEIEPSDEREPEVWDPKAEVQFQELLKKIKDGRDEKV